MQRKGIMTVAGVAAALAAGLAPATAGEAKQAVGEEIFIRYCAVCHGVDGAGNGPLADALKAVPPDLTTLAKRNGGRFPTDRVAETIHNGAAPGHGKAMIAWGRIFEKEGGAPSAAAHILDLTLFIESLQQK